MKVAYREALERRSTKQKNEKQTDFSRKMKDFEKKMSRDFVELKDFKREERIK